MKQVLMASVAGLALCGSAMAADVALIIGNSDYVSLRDVRGGADVLDASDEFASLGFRVIDQEDVSRVGLAGAVENFVRQSVDAERVLVILAGRFVNSSQDTWLLPVDAPSLSSLAQLPGQGLAFSTVMSVLEAHPGKAMLLIGDDDESGEGGTYLRRGVGAINAAQGVTVFRGSTRAIAGFAEDILPLPAMARTV